MQPMSHLTVHIAPPVPGLAGHGAARIAPPAEPAASAPEASPAIATASVLAAPALRLDAGLGLVVLEFRDLDGKPRTIPSARELESYRTAAQSVGHPSSTATGEGVQGSDATGNVADKATMQAVAAPPTR